MSCVLYGNLELFAVTFSTQSSHAAGPIQQHASMVTTEISQVPLSGVLALLKAAKLVGERKGEKEEYVLLGFLSHAERLVFFQF